MLWADPERFLRGIPIYFYEVTRGIVEPKAEASWTGTFLEYKRREDFTTQAELDATRPSSTISRRDPTVPEEQQEPDGLATC